MTMTFILGNKGLDIEFPFWKHPWLYLEVQLIMTITLFLGNKGLDIDLPFRKHPKCTLRSFPHDYQVLLRE